MAATPSTDNYRIPAGIGYFKLPADTAYRDLGMLEDFAVSTANEKLEHRDTRTPGGPIDFTLLTKVTRTVKFTMVELVQENMALLALGTVSTNTAGEVIIDEFTNTAVAGHLKFVSTNDTGPVWTYEAYVSIQPTGDFTLLANQAALTQIQIEAQVGKDPVTARYGRWALGA